MTSRRQTLGQYMHKVQGDKILKKAKSCSKTACSPGKTLSDEVDLKKRNVDSIMSVLKAKVKKLVVSDTKALDILDTIERASQQIKNGFDEIGHFVNRQIIGPQEFSRKSTVSGQMNQLQSLTTTQNQEDLSGSFFQQVSPNKRAPKTESPRRMSYQFNETSFMSVVHPIVGSEARHRKISSKENSIIQQFEESFERQATLQQNKDKQFENQQNNFQVLTQQEKMLKQSTNGDVLNVAFKCESRVKSTQRMRTKIIRPRGY